MNSLDDLPKRGEGVQVFDKDGTQITMRQWARLLEDWEYKRVALTQLASGWKVSTVWLGLDHNWSQEPDATPIIFETMFFCDEPDGGTLFDEYQERYSTMEQALEGHERAVKYARGVLELREEELNVDASGPES